MQNNCPLQKCDETLTNLWNYFLERLFSAERMGIVREWGGLEIWRLSQSHC